MKRSFTFSAVVLGSILMIAASCGTPRTVSSYPYPGSPYPGSPYPGGTTYPYPGSPYPGSYPYPESYPGRYPYPQRTPPVVVYREPQKVYVPERRKEVIVEHRNDRRYDNHGRNDDHDHDHDRNHNGSNHRSNSKN